MSTWKCRPLPASWKPRGMTAATVDRRGAGTYAAFCSSRSTPVAPELGARSNRAAGDRFAGLERGSALGSLRGSEKMVSTGHSQQLTGTTIGQPRHICAFFNTVDEQHLALRPSMKD